ITEEYDDEGNIKIIKDKKSDTTGKEKRKITPLPSFQEIDAMSKEDQNKILRFSFPVVSDFLSFIILIFPSSSYSSVIKNSLSVFSQFGFSVKVAEYSQPFSNVILYQVLLSFFLSCSPFSTEMTFSNSQYSFMLVFSSSSPRS
ncbi:MAG TPA: hypothetical protein GX530_07545, partial [Corynebacteriales bacterium]|nr:hypothetical protein [Mycobacteriales bacterium]